MASTTKRCQLYEIVLELAVNGGAESIVTFNMRDFGLAPEKFNINLMTPAQALRSICSGQVFL